MEYAQPNWIYTHAGAPKDPLFPLQRALENTGQAVAGHRGTAGADIRALHAWEIVPDAKSVYVGVLDEGIDFRHRIPVWTNPFDPVDGIRQRRQRLRGRRARMEDARR